MTVISGRSSGAFSAWFRASARTQSLTSAGSGGRVGMGGLRTSNHSSPRSSGLCDRKGDRHSAASLGTSLNHRILSPAPYLVTRCRLIVAFSLRKASRAAPFVATCDSLFVGLMVPQVCYPRSIVTHCSWPSHFALPTMAPRKVDDLSAMLAAVQRIVLFERVASKTLPGVETAQRFSDAGASRGRARYPHLPSEPRALRDRRQGRPRSSSSARGSSSR